MTEPFDWTTDADSTADPFDQVTYAEAPIDPYFVVDDPFAPALDEAGQFIVDEPVFDWVEVSTDDVVDISYDWSDASDWLIIDPAVPLDPGYTVLEDGFAYTDTGTGWIDLGTGSCDCTDIGLSAVDAPSGWDAPITLEVPQPADGAVYQSPQAETTPVVAFDPASLAEPVAEAAEPANTFVVGGTDIFGQDATDNVATIDIGGIGTFDNLGTGDPNSSGTIMIGGSDFEFGSGPSMGQVYLEMVKVQEQVRQRNQATLDAMMNSALADPSGLSPADIRTLYNIQTSSADQVRIGLLPSYESEYNAGLVYSRDDWQRRHNMSFS